MARMLKVKELQEELSISRATIYRLIEEGLPYELIGVRTKLFDPDEVRAFIANRREGIEALEPGVVINNATLCEVFKCSSQGGMRRSHATNTLVLVSDHSDPNNVYEDKWEGEILYYTGMGQEGNQDINFAQNRTLADSNSNGVVVYLFEVFESSQYTYRGIVKLVGEPFQIQEGGRDVWKFPIKIIAGEKAIDEQIVKKLEQAKLDNSKRLTDEQLKNKALAEGSKGSSRVTKSVTYERNMYVAEYAKRRAKGKCQLCGVDAPFIDKNGEPFLESHHVLKLADGGEDTIYNCAGICPNCHRKCHSLNLKEDFDKLMGLMKKYREEGDVGNDSERF